MVLIRVILIQIKYNIKINTIYGGTYEKSSFSSNGWRWL